VKEMLVIPLIELLTMPLIILNIFGGIAAGVWLAILGQWGTIGRGFATIMGGHFALMIALLPQMAITASSYLLFERGHKFIGFIVGALALIYLYGLITVWCAAVLWYSLAGLTSEAAFIPTLVWSYGVATAPWSYRAWHEPENAYTRLTLLFMGIGYVVMVLMVLLGRPTFYGVIEAFVGVMAVAAVVSLAFWGTALRAPQSP
jgi:hypothetical protein